MLYYLVPCPHRQFYFFNRFGCINHSATLSLITKWTGESQIFYCVISGLERRWGLTCVDPNGQPWGPVGTGVPWSTPNYSTRGDMPHRSTLWTVCNYVLYVTGKGVIRSFYFISFRKCQFPVLEKLAASLLCCIGISYLSRSGLFSSESMHWASVSVKHVNLLFPCSWNLHGCCTTRHCLCFQGWET